MQIEERAPIAMQSWMEIYPRDLNSFAGTRVDGDRITGRVVLVDAANARFGKVEALVKRI